MLRLSACGHGVCFSQRLCCELCPGCLFLLCCGAMLACVVLIGAFLCWLLRRALVPLCARCVLCPPLFAAACPLCCVRLLLRACKATVGARQPASRPPWAMLVSVASPSSSSSFFPAIDRRRRPHHTTPPKRHHARETTEKAHPQRNDSRVVASSAATGFSSARARSWQRQGARNHCIGPQSTVGECIEPFSRRSCCDGSDQAIQNCTTTATDDELST